MWGVELCTAFDFLAIGSNLETFITSVKRRKFVKEPSFSYLLSGILNHAGVNKLPLVAVVLMIILLEVTKIYKTLSSVNTYSNADTF
jgi:hypothetical protein